MCHIISTKNNLKFIIFFLFHLRKYMNSKNMKIIASGSGSQIYLYPSKAGNFALKFVSVENKKELLHLANEAKVLSALDHDYIIKSIKYQ